MTITTSQGASIRGHEGTSVIDLAQLNISQLHKLKWKLSSDHSDPMKMLSPPSRDLTTVIGKPKREGAKK